MSGVEYNKIDLALVFELSTLVDIINSLLEDKYCEVRNKEI